MAIAIALTLLLTINPAITSDDPPPPGVRAVAFSPDGKLLAATTGEPNEPGTLTVWEVGTWTTRFTHVAKTGISCVCFSPDSKTVAIGGFEQTTRLFETATGELHGTLRNPNPSRAVNFSPDGRRLATGGIDRKVQSWNAATGDGGQTLGEHSDRVYTVEFSADGKHLVSAGGNEVCLWDAASGKELWRRGQGNSLVRCAIFSPDSRHVISGGWDGTVRIWKTANGDPLTTFRPRGGVDAVAFSAPTRTLAVCTNFKNFFLLDLTFDEPSANEIEHIRGLIARLDDESYEVREAAGKELLAVGFVAEAELRKAMDESKSVEVRMRARRLCVELLSRRKAEISGHEGRVETVAFSRDGKLLASGGKDGAVRVWDAASHKEVTCLMPSAKGKN